MVYAIDTFRIGEGRLDRNGESDMKCVECYEVKSCLPGLLGRVEKGETITITRNGKPIAKIVPVTGMEQAVVPLVEEMLAFRDERGPLLGEEITVRDLIEEGRP